MQSSQMLIHRKGPFVTHLLVSIFKTSIYGQTFSLALEGDNVFGVYIFCSGKRFSFSSALGDPSVLFVV